MDTPRKPKKKFPIKKFFLVSILAAFVLALVANLVVFGHITSCGINNRLLVITVSAIAFGIVVLVGVCLLFRKRIGIAMLAVLATLVFGVVLFYLIGMNIGYSPPGCMSPNMLPTI